MERPGDLFDREREWAALTRFATDEGPGMTLGTVYGRRRQGKSYLLRRLVRAVGGFYHQAQEVERAPALQRFADDVASTMGLPAGQLAFPGWDAALRAALRTPPGGPAPGPRRLVVIDELPYLLAHSPEIPSILQLMYDDATDDGTSPPTSVILCGSALSVMTGLLSGAQALRGRARLDLLLRPFDARLAARFWGADDPEVAFQVGAVLGGAPGYRSLVGRPAPTSAAQLPAWFARTVLDPSHALYRETDYLLREDPRLTDRALYTSVLRAVAAGRSTPAGIAGVLARDARSLAHPLDVLLSAGFLRREDDVLLQRRPTYQVADPVVRFAQLVTEPRAVALEEGDVAGAWSAAAPAFSSGVLGPHFERTCVEWTARHAGDRWPEPIGEVGPTVVNDRAGRAQHQLDVVALPRGVPRHTGDAVPVVLGEAKASHRRRTLADLERLDHVRALLVGRGVPAGGAALALFARSGFDRDLQRVAAHREEVHLVDLAELYGVPA